jgi:molybdate transport system ATP-binding protein
MNGLSARIGLRRPEFRLALRLDLPANGVTVLLGPSGSGKTTLLRVLAGLERPQLGRIVAQDTVWFDAEKKINLPASQRRVGFVFQDYALFPHMTVAGNVGYGVARAHRAPRVAQWLARLHLTPYAGRYPHQLSGGQRQRVALARALASRPRVLLLDEPFSAVDSSLRRQLRDQLLAAVSGLDYPVLLVTHDLEEARYLATHVGVMVNGALPRIGTAADVFADPGSREVAQVLGWCNFLPVQRLIGARVTGSWGEVPLEREPSVDSAWLSIRPEHIRLALPGQTGLSARISGIIELGALRALNCHLGDGTPVTLHRPWDEPLPAPGSQVRLHLPLQHLRPLVDIGTTEPLSGNSAACHTQHPLSRQPKRTAGQKGRETVA